MMIILLLLLQSLTTRAFFQDTLPPTTMEVPGKFWFDNDNTTRVWDQDNQVWVRAGLGGPPGPIGPTGTYRTIVSDSAPTGELINTIDEW